MGSVRTPGSHRLLAALTLAAVLAIAAWEAGLALVGPRRVAGPQHWHAAAQAVRASFLPGDLIVVAPEWASPLVRRHLGDLMPASMVGRPDAARYARIWELSLRGAQAPETAGLPVEGSSQHGPIRLTRYRNRPVQVTFDLVDAFVQARVFQHPLAGGADGEMPCWWGGPPPGPTRGEAGGFYCRGSKIERRVMEIDYQPRLGVVVPAEPALRTVIQYESIPAAAWQGAQLVAWFGLHDYYARKTDSGPVDVVVEVGPGQDRVSVSVPPQGWHRVKLRPRSPGWVRIEVSARDARARLLGFAAELRR
ncbi:MAG: hypothetical protein NZ890_20130 [Myxococcota bacterium]|nr:hypothetical protein [Myxococcota bacterium]